MNTNIEFKRERLNAIRPHIDGLLDFNYDELTLNKHVIKLNPDWVKYDQLEQENKLIIFTVRHSGVLVGYSFFIVDTHLHYKDLVVANNDVLFIRKDYRQGMLGIKFLKFCDAELHHVDKIVWHVKDANDFKPILHRMGYKNEDTLVGKLRVG
jgi:hypothetical protein